VFDGRQDQRRLWGTEPQHPWPGESGIASDELVDRHCPLAGRILDAPIGQQRDRPVRVDFADHEPEDPTVMTHVAHGGPGIWPKVAIDLKLDSNDVRCRDQAGHLDPDAVDLGERIRRQRRAAVDGQLEVERPRPRPNGRITAPTDWYGAAVAEISLVGVLLDRS
jgi:hypothetical protein